MLPLSRHKLLLFFSSSALCKNHKHSWNIVLHSIPVQIVSWHASWRHFLLWFKIIEFLNWIWILELNVATEFGLPKLFNNYDRFYRNIRAMTLCILWSSREVILLIVKLHAFTERECIRKRVITRVSQKTQNNTIV